MITDFIFSVLTAPLHLLLNLLPAVSIAIPNNVFTGFNSILGMLGFIFPVAGLLPILAISLSIKGFHIIWALIIRVKSFIPTMGS